MMIAINIDDVPTRGGERGREMDILSKNHDVDIYIETGEQEKKLEDGSRLQRAGGL